MRKQAKLSGRIINEVVTITASEVAGYKKKRGMIDMMQKVR